MKFSITFGFKRTIAPVYFHPQAKKWWYLSLSIRKSVNIAPPKSSTSFVKAKAQIPPSQWSCLNNKNDPQQKWRSLKFSYQFL